MAEADTRASENPIRVLHVDDEPDFAELAATFIEREDERFDIEVAPSAGDGLDLLTTDTFDCVVSDYDMPGETGIDFLETVREEFPDLPFVLFTGKGSEEIASDAISKGVSDYLQKGMGTDRYSLLANRIRNLVAQYRAETQLETRVEQQRHVAELGQNGLAGVAPEELFEQAVEAVADTLGNEYAKVLEHRPEHDDLLLRAGVGWRDGLVGEATVGMDDDSQAGHTLRSEEPIIVEELRTDDRFSGPPLLVDHDVVSGISVIIGSPDEPWGVLGTHTTEQTTFTSDDVTFVQSVANVLATAIERTEREAELRRTTRAIEAAPVGVSISDPAQADNPLIYVNDEFTALTGYEEAEVIGRNCRFLQGEDTEEGSIAAMRGAIADREPVTVELRNYRRDGSPFWNRVTIAPVVDEDGTLQNFVGFQEDITPRKEQEREREAVIEFLQRLYDVATDAEMAFEQKVTRLLAVGHEELGLPYGCLTRIEVDDEVNERGTQMIIEASGDHDLLQPGESCPLRQSYCRQTIKQDGLMEISDAIAAGWADDPAFEMFDLGSYIGTRITVDDSLYGTVFFASATPRDEPFTEAERTFVRLMSQWVSYELEREEIVSRLTRQNEQLVKQKRTLLADSAVRLELRVHDPAEFFCQFSDALGCTVTLLRANTDEEGGYYVILEVESDDVDQIDEVCDRFQTVDEVRYLNSSEGGSVVELHVGEAPVVDLLASHGSLLDSLTSAGGHCELTVELASTSDVRSLVDELQSNYDEVELLSRREQPTQPHPGLGLSLDELLTERQLEVLETAYVSGYFEESRTRSGADIADQLDISNPTFHHHIRASQRRILEELLDDQGAS